MSSTSVADSRFQQRPAMAAEGGRPSYGREIDLETQIRIIENEMAEAAARLNFERAALLRDQLFECRALLEGKGGRKKKKRAASGALLE